jgi:hypothetical protein
VQGLGDQLLAGAALARDEDVGGGVRHARDHLRHLLERWAIADDAGQLDGLGAAAQALQLFAHRAVANCAFER